MAPCARTLELWGSSKGTNPAPLQECWTDRVNWDIFLWHVHNTPRKLFLYVGVTLINLSYKGQWISAAQFCYSNWMLQRHIRNTQFCEQPTFDYEKITLWSFCAFLLPGFKLSMLGLMREIRGGHTNGINPRKWPGTPYSFSCNRGASKHSIKLKVANAELKGKAFLYNIINLENSLPRENIEAKTY